MKKINELPGYIGYAILSSKKADKNWYGVHDYITSDLPKKLQDYFRFINVQNHNETVTQTWCDKTDHYVYFKDDRSYALFHNKKSPSNMFQSRIWEKYIDTPSGVKVPIFNYFAVFHFNKPWTIVFIYRLTKNKWWPKLKRHQQANYQEYINWLLNNFYNNNNYDTTFATTQGDPNA